MPFSGVHQRIDGTRGRGTLLRLSMQTLRRRMAASIPVCYKPSMDDIYAMPGHLIRRAQQISTALFAEECSQFDLTSVQYAILSSVAASPGSDATRLSALIAFDRSTLGDVLERMELKKWIVRTASPADRRVKLVRLTPAGTRLLGRVAPAVQRVQARLLAPLSPADQQTFIRLLQSLATTYNDATSAPLRIADPK